MRRAWAATAAWRWWHTGIRSSVYDDVAGWDANPYLATGELYMDHADYDVQVTAPSAMLVAATGVLQNAESVVTPSARERLQRAARSFALVPRGGVAPDTVLVHAYRPRVRSWRAAADDGRLSIEHFSRLLWAYPWPQMTLVEGIVEGGMEHPMLSAVSVGVRRA